jgi:hypothetical protein
MPLLFGIENKPFLAVTILAILTKQNNCVMSAKTEGIAHRNVVLMV